MSEMEYTGMAVCGLDCGMCDIRLVPHDAEAAERVADWFRNMGWLEEEEGPAEIIARGMCCRGCLGDRSLHWSPDCPMLLCCVDERHLTHCGECAEFDCQKLVDFASQSVSHSRAVDHLRELAEQT